jgi:hypothetical protein
MRRKISNSRWLYYGLFVLVLTAATAGKLVLLGCKGDPVETTKDITWVDPTQRDPDGRVWFREGDGGKTEARLILPATYDGAPVTWRVRKDKRPYAYIPDPARSNEVVILRPTTQDWGNPHAAEFEGEYQKDGKTRNTYKYVPVGTYQ